MRYMELYRVQWGFLSTYTHTIFIWQDPMTGKVHYSNTFCSTTAYAKGGRPTLRMALLYVAAREPAIGMAAPRYCRLPYSRQAAPWLQSIASTFSDASDRASNNHLAYTPCPCHGQPCAGDAWIAYRQCAEKAHPH